MEFLSRFARIGPTAVRDPAQNVEPVLRCREKKSGLELDEAMSLVDGAGKLDQRPAPSHDLRRRIVTMRATGKTWKAIAAELDISESTAIYHANRATERPTRYRPVVATLAPGARRQDASETPPRRHPRMASPGLEPGTPRFSVVCSTN